MIKQRLFTAAAALLLTAGAYAQYYGKPFYTEGFESAANFANWTVETTLAPTKETSKLWNLQADADLSDAFSDIDATSTHSLSITVAEGERLTTSITSPLIDATGKSDLFVGMYGYNVFTKLIGWHGLTLKFQIKEEGSDTWQDLTTFPSSTDVTSTEVYNVEKYQTHLPAAWDGKKFRLRLLFNCDDEDGYQYY